MQVSVEKISNVERRLTIIVPLQQVEEVFTRQINAFAKKTTIKGFRPGKAPVGYIKERYGAEVRKEALGEIIQKSLYEALSTHQLTPINTPQIEPKVVAPDQPLEFVATFDVLPEISQIQFNMEQIEKSVVDITPEDIDRVIQQVRKQHTQWQIVDRVAKEIDRVVIDYYAIFDGKADKEQMVKDFPLELGSKAMIPGFEEGLIGAKAGEERTLHLQFPTDFKDTEKAGKPVDFVVMIKQIFEAEVPALDDSFIQKLGIKSGQLADLKTQINQTLSQERDRLVKEKLKEKIFQCLLEQNLIEVPKSLIAQEAQRIHNEAYPHKHDHHRHAAEELTHFNDIAKKRVALGLLIAEYVKQNELKVDKERVTKRIEEIAATYEHPPEVVTWLSAPERRSGIEAQVMEDQVMEKLLERVSMTEKNISYSELIGIRV